MKTIYVERLKQIDGQWKWEPEVEILDLDGDFGVDELNLDRELCRMGQILVRYGGLAAELQAELKRKEEYVKLIQARLAGALRSQYEAAGTKTTEGKLSEEVTTNVQYQEALAGLFLLRSHAISVDHYYRAAIKKADMLNALAYRQTAEMKKAYV